MLLSIIIPVYNVEKYVEKCVLSCEDQDLKKSEYEIIVVNDGSPDGSLSIVDRLANEYSNIKIISQNNGGLSAARNTGMRNAVGEYYMFVDSDDWIASNCLGMLAEKLIAEKPDALAICAANVIDGKIYRRFSYYDVTPIPGRDLLKKGVSPCAPFSIWNASFLNKNNLSFYTGIFHEDSEFTPRAYYLADKVSFVDDIIYYVYQNPSSITRSPNPKKAFDLVEIVCTHLSSFAKEVNNEDKVIFYDLVGLYLNNAMATITGDSEEMIDRLNSAIEERSYLWADIRKSDITKYKVEAYLCSIFKRHPLKVYNIMQKFNRNH